jgi:Glycosyl-transferase for dystroglycan
VVYSERVADDAAAALFPINILRNNAILVARTPLVLLADADLLVGADLADAMADPLQ